MNFNKYTIGARLFPSMISAVPFFVLGHYYLTPKIGDFVAIVSSYTWIGDLTISAAAVYLLMQVSRWISKPLFEDRIFDRGNQFPTTSFLLHTDTYYSSNYTHQIHERIIIDFDIILHSKQDEQRNLQDARKRIKEAISLVRNMVSDSGLVLQHNIEYGFARNLAGGSVIAFITSAVSAFLFYFVEPIDTAFTVSVIISMLYGMYLLLSKRIMKYLGANYADVLISEYMNARK